MRLSIITSILAATAIAMPVANPVAEPNALLAERGFISAIKKFFKSIGGGPKRPSDIVPDIKEHFKVSNDGIGNTFIEKWGTKKQN